MLLYLSAILAYILTIIITEILINMVDPLALTREERPKIKYIILIITFIIFIMNMYSFYKILFDIIFFK